MRKQTEPLFDPDLDDLAVREAFRRLDDQPSAALDAAILAAARQAVAPVAPTTGASADVIVFKPKRRWFAPIGLAASLTLAVGIAWHVQYQPESALHEPQAEIARERAETTVAPAADAASAPPAPTVLYEPAAPAAADTLPVPLQAPSPAPALSPPSKPIAIPSLLGEPTTQAAEPTKAQPKMVAPAPEAAPAAPAPATAGKQYDPYQPEPSRPEPKAERAAPEVKAQHGDLGGVLSRSKNAPAQEPSLFPVKEASFLAAVEAVRQLLREEQTVAARAALARLRRDYPDKELPADLQALAQEIDRARDK